jgi:hypothetical protein
MAKIITNIPDPKAEYSVENQRLINLALNQIVQKLNTSYQEDLKNEVERYTWFNSGGIGG